VIIAVDEILSSGPDRNQPLSRGDYLWFEDERSINIKLIQFIDTSLRDARRGAQDLELGRAVGALRHVRCHPSDVVYGNDALAFGGVRELWWPTLTAFHRGVAAAPSAWQELTTRH